MGFPGGSVVKNTPAMQEMQQELWVPSPRLGRSPGEGNGNPLHYSYLENLLHRGAWWATNICKVKILNLFGFSSDVRLYLFVLSENEYFFLHLFVIYIFLQSAAVSCPFVWKYLSFSHCL